MGAHGNDGVALRGNALKSAGVGAIRRANFAVVLDWVEGDSGFCTIEMLEGGEIRGLAYDLHLLGAFEEVIDEAGQTVVVAEAKMAEEEEAHFINYYNILNYNN